MAIVGRKWGVNARLSHDAQKFKYGVDQAFWSRGKSKKAARNSTIIIILFATLLPDTQCGGVSQDEGYFRFYKVTNGHHLHRT